MAFDKTFGAITKVLNANKTDPLTQEMGITPPPPAPSVKKRKSFIPKDHAMITPRIPKHLKESLVIAARDQEVSLNTLVTKVLLEYALKLDGVH